MADVWCVSVLRLVVQLFEFRGVAPDMHFSRNVMQSPGTIILVID
jgi:hypothetical protein